MKSGKESGKESGTEKPVVTRLSKHHSDFWAPRLTKLTYKYKPDGAKKAQTYESPDYSVRIQYKGDRDWFNLGSPNKAQAAQKAKEIYNCLVNQGGWPVARAKYKPQSEISAGKDVYTLGEYLEAVQGLGTIKPATFAIYAKFLRSVVADICKIEGGKKRFDYRGGGHQEWVAKVEAVSLSKLTPGAIAKWRADRIAATAGDPLKNKRTLTSVRTSLLNCKALFGKKKVIRALLNVAPDAPIDVTEEKLKAARLPYPLPFSNVLLPKVQDQRFKSKFSRVLLWKQAEAQLEPAEPELFKILVLALGAGLRRDEIDTLEWKHVRFDTSEIICETTEHGGRKSDHSEGTIKVGSQVMAALKRHLPKPGEGGPFVIRSRVRPIHKATYHHYRLAALFPRLNAWLKAHGVDYRCPLHALRKQYGSDVCKKGGIAAASKMLRHASLHVTMAHYTDVEPVVVDLDEVVNAPAESSKSG